MSLNKIYKAILKAFGVTYTYSYNYPISVTHNEEKRIKIYTTEGYDEVLVGQISAITQYIDDQTGGMTFVEDVDTKGSLVLIGNSERLEDDAHFENEEDDLTITLIECVVLSSLSAEY